MNERARGCLWSPWTPLFFSVFSLASVARAADPCVSAATAAHAAASAADKPAPLQGPSCLVLPDNTRANLEDPQKECALGHGTHLYFKSEEHARNQGRVVRPLTSDVEGCTALYYVTEVVGEPQPKPTAAPAPALAAARQPGSEGPCAVPESAECKALDSLLTKDAADLLRGLDSNHAELIRSASPTVGTATGAAEIVAEAVQILGQIVVDRATQSAYRMLNEKIKQGLCLTTGGEDNKATNFPATCEAIDSIRIQELAMSRNVLLRALAADIVQAALRLLGPISDEVATAVREAVAGGMALRKIDKQHLEGILQGMVLLERDRSSDAIRRALEAGGFAADEINAMLAATAAAAPAEDAIRFATSTVVPLLLGTLSDPTQTRAGDAARAIVAEAEAFARARASAATAEVEERWQPFVLAAGALVSCQVLVAKREVITLGDCDISREVDRFNGTTRAKAVGRSLARSLQVALVGRTGTLADPERRLVSALSGVFDAVCFAVDPNKSLGCPAILDIAREEQAQVVLPLSAARGMLEAAVERDTNRMVATAVRTLDLAVLPAAATAAKSSHQKRALRLLAGVVAYAETFTPKQGGDEPPDDDQLHEQRTKILESLTADMTDRTGREGDVITSLGGSLALTSGVRTPLGGDASAVYNGPFSLSLGFALQNIPDECPIGWHIEVGVLDLAQYLSFQETPKEPPPVDPAAPVDPTAPVDPEVPNEKEIVVREPKLQDAVSPSLKIGFQWGRDVPFFVAAVVGYAPFYEFKDDNGLTDRHGALTVGAAFGAYVPFIDVN